MSDILLKGTKKTIISVDYDHVDDAITKFLIEKDALTESMRSEKEKGRSPRYECIPENEWGNDQEQEIEVRPKDLDADDKLDMFCVSTGDILDWMCFEGRVEAGTYLVSICW
jgi:hypothetical protein